MLSCGFSFSAVPGCRPRSTRSAEGRSLPKRLFCFLFIIHAEQNGTTELDNKFKGAAALSHQFLKAEESREDVGIGISQKFGFFHHLKYIFSSFLGHSHIQQKSFAVVHNNCLNNFPCWLKIWTLFRLTHLSSTQLHNLSLLINSTGSHWRNNFDVGAYI